MYIAAHHLQRVSAFCKKSLRKESREMRIFKQIKKTVLVMLLCALGRSPGGKRGHEGGRLPHLAGLLQGLRRQAWLEP